MPLATALVLIAAQTGPPALTPGASEEFNRNALAVEAKLVAGDVAGAREAVRRLPVRTPHLQWVGLPVSLQKARETAVSRSTAIWGDRVQGFALTEGGTPDLTIKFDPTDAKAARFDEGILFQASLAFKDEASVSPGLAYAVGRYLGVGDSPYVHINNETGAFVFSPRPSDIDIAARNLRLAEALRGAVEAGKPLGLSLPVSELKTARFDFGDVRQGKPILASIDLTNTGAGPLYYRITPDCGCFRMKNLGTVAPGKTARLPFEVDTTYFTGAQHKRLLFQTNDPAHPAVEIPVAFRSKPAYRLFRPGGENVTVGDAGGTYDVFLFSDPANPIRPTAARWDGLDAKLTWMPWEGTLADPEMGEGALPRKGWRFRIRLTPDLIPGVVPGTLSVDTDSESFGTVRYTLNAQKGIVALNQEVFFGDVVPGAKATIVLRRPGRPFKVTGVDAGPFRATWRDVREGTEYAVELEYTGGAAKGDLKLPIKIRTDDPKQPVVEALASGTVK